MSKWLIVLLPVIHHVLICSHMCIQVRHLLISLPVLMSTLPAWSLHVEVNTWWNTSPGSDLVNIQSTACLQPWPLIRMMFTCCSGQCHWHAIQKFPLSKLPLLTGKCGINTFVICSTPIRMHWSTFDTYAISILCMIQPFLKVMHAYSQLYYIIQYLIALQYICIIFINYNSDGSLLVASVPCPWVP